MRTELEQAIIKLAKEIQTNKDISTLEKMQLAQAALSLAHTREVIGVIK